MKNANPTLDKEPAEGSRGTVEAALRRQWTRGISNLPLEQERAEQAKLPPRGQASRKSRQRGVPSVMPRTARGESLSRDSQASARKAGTRSTARKAASAHRGGKPPGKSRPKAGAWGMSRRRPTNTVRAKRGTQAR